MVYEKVGAATTVVLVAVVKYLSLEEAEGHVTLAVTGKTFPVTVAKLAS